MADYYSILKKTIASLPENNGAARRSVYSRARNAIVNQLKAYEPPLSPSEITAEQLRLEEAIRKVEAEAARESLGLSGTPAKPAASHPASQTAERPASPPAQSTPPARVEPSLSHPAPQPATQAGVTPSVTAATQPVLSPLKETLSAVAPLGQAANKAVQEAKEAFDQPAPDPDATPVRREPVFSSSPQQSVHARAQSASEPEPEAEEDEIFYDDEPDQPVVKPVAQKDGKPRKEKPVRSAPRQIPWTPIALIAALVFVGIGIVAILYSQKDTIASVMGGDQNTSDMSAVSPSEPAPVSEPAATTEGSSKNADRLLNDSGEPVVAPDARAVTTTLITPNDVTPPVEAPAEPSQPAIVTATQPAPEPAPAEPAAAPVEMPASQPESVPPAEVAAVDPANEPVVPAPAASNSSVQRSILYEEGDEASGAGTASQGAVQWEIQEETDLNGKSQAVLSASVEIPERNLHVDIRIKPNDDTSLPASHLVEIKYQLPEDFSAGDIVNVPGLVMKPTEEARGDALLGASVKVSPGYFWIALSSLPNERDRNMALLRERGWIDIPMLYDNGKRGILTIEKGSVGDAAVEKAVTAWKAG